LNLSVSSSHSRFWSRLSITWMRSAIIISDTSDHLSNLN
jgi:hypothetical protein